MKLHVCIQGREVRGSALDKVVVRLKEPDAIDDWWGVERWASGVCKADALVRAKLRNCA